MRILGFSLSFGEDEQFTERSGGRPPQPAKVYVRTRNSDGILEVRDGQTVQIRDDVGVLPLGASGTLEDAESVDELLPSVSFDDDISSSKHRLRRRIQKWH